MQGWSYTGDDGQAPPEDWMSDSPEKTTVADAVIALLVLLSL